MSPSDMAETVQKHLKGADDSVLKSQHFVRMFPLSRYIPTQEKKKQTSTWQM